MAVLHQLRATFIETWPRALEAMSIPSVAVEMDADDVVALGSFHPGFRDRFGLREVVDLSDALNGRLADGLRTFDRGAMPRLGYCSWKASALDHRPVRTLRDLIAVITRPDDRVARALEMAAVTNEGTVLHLREWMDMDPAGEFRLFIQNRRLVGASQYFWSAEYPSIAQNILSVRERMSRFVGSLLATIHVDDVIADLYLPPAGSDEPLLIELNPLVPEADHCLYQAGRFDGRLRVVSGGRTQSTTLDL